MRRWLFLAVLASSAAALDNRALLNGTWHLDPSHSKIAEEKVKSETLEIQQNEDSIHFTDSMTDPEGKERKSGVDCNTVGKECKLKGEQVSFWYNGPALIMMETRRNSEVVIKKSLKASEDGQTLNVEVTHIAPVGEKNETLTFRKQ